MTLDLDPLLLRDFAIALFIGALVGVDREHRAAAGPRQFGGLRTFMLTALLGGVSAWLSTVLAAPWLVAVALAGLSALLLSYWIGTESPEAHGLTTEVAAMVVFLLGAATVAGHAEVAVVLAIATTALLAYKTPLHRMAQAIEPDDLAAGLKLLFATFIMLPLLPDRTVDPWGALNPYRLWWLVVLVSGLSLLGYAAVRVWGERRGLALTGVFGGLVSSTAVTLSSARQSKTGTGGPDALAMAVLLAWTVMFGRVVIEVALVNQALLRSVVPPMVAMGLVAAGASAWLATRGPAGSAASEAVPLRNPFSLWEAIKFALLFAAVLVAVELGRRFLGEGWLYGLAVVAGATDVDAITLSMAELAGRELDPAVAATAIVLATASNTVVKCALVWGLGSRALGQRVLVATLGIAVAGVLAVWLAT